MPKTRLSRTLLYERHVTNVVLHLSLCSCVEHDDTYVDI